MARHKVDVRPQAQDVLRTLASLIRERRLSRGWSQQFVAERLRISPTTYRALERGSGQVSAGTLFNAATLMDIPLFAEDATGLARLAQQREQINALLPRRAVSEKFEVDDDF